ncbi:hypothetical protein JCM11491_006643 [Sporobolomyces phaffii]
MATPPQPSLVLTSPVSPPPPPSTTSSRRPSSSSSAGPTLRTSASHAQLRPTPPSRSPARSRSPSPTPSATRRWSSSSSGNSTSGGISALAAAGLGLVSLPPSPNPDRHAGGFDLDGEDAQEELATPPRPRRSRSRSRSQSRDRTRSEARKSSIGFLEPDREPRSQSRARKMSFGLGLEGKMRRLSFGGNGAASVPASGSGLSLREEQFGIDNATGMPMSLSPSLARRRWQRECGAEKRAKLIFTFRAPRAVVSSANTPAPTSRKSNKPKTLIRRAKSFGTSPLLGGPPNNRGTFPSPVPSTTDDARPALEPSTSSSPPSPGGENGELSTSAHASLTRLTPSSISLASSSRSARSPTSPTFPTHQLRPPIASARSSEERRRVEEPASTPTHWLLSPLVPVARPSAESTPVDVKGKRRESEERTGLGFEEFGLEPKTGAKDKDKDKKKGTSAFRRATLSVFGRRDTTPVLSNHRPEEEPRRNSVDPPYSGALITDSPTGSPAQSRKNSAGNGLPSLPSLPSLQLSSNPYRMSWAFGSGSPTTSPASSPARQRLGGTPSRSDSPVPIVIPTSSRPSLTISPVPSPRAPSSQASPVSANPSSLSSSSPLRHETLDQLPVPPLLTHTLSTDSSKTLVVTLPPPPSNAFSPTPQPPRMIRAHSASSPPLLRRTASYASTSPSPSSPLASPPLPLPLPSTSEPSHLDRRRTLTRSARSHSDASDRRSPSLTTPPLSSGTSFTYGGGRGSVTGSTGVPPGGGYFASAHYRAGTTPTPTPRRPGTADSPSNGRTSVFGFAGGWGSLFGGSGSSGTSTSTNAVSNSTTASVGMSRSSSAATSTPSTPGAGGVETNEFGALFDGSAGGGGGGAKPSRPGTGRKRGLSVGNGFFGSASTSNSVSRERDSGRARSGSGSSVASDAPLRAPGVLGRMRASTDPNKRLSIGSSNLGGLAANASNTSFGLAPPSSSSRPATSEGVASLFGGGGGTANRKRGSSLSFVSSSQQAISSPTMMQGFREEPKPAKKYPTPKIHLGETPEEFVARLMAGDGEGGEGRVGKGDVSRVLSASADPFYQQALATYLRYFPFAALPLDIALRLFLCSSSLPPETQQIDRVMEAFARRWCECNPDLFVTKGTSAPKAVSSHTGVDPTVVPEGKPDEPRQTKAEVSDIPYVLAFSMVMLNTDAFNPNAKSKMTKADYVKNTKIPGVATELLEYLYDQITLAPFVFVDEENPAAALFDPSPTLSSSSSRPDPSATGTPTGFFGSASQKPKVDPYHYIATGQTYRFRVDVESHIPFKSPFSYSGTTSFFNATTLHTLFAKAPILQTSSRPRAPSRSQTAAPNIATQIPPSALAGSPLAPTVSSSTFVATPAKDKATVSNLKITKVGVLSRKEDLAEGGKKAASRKWKAWSVVLTGSQLLFFKDAHFAQTLQQTLEAAAVLSHPRPDENHVLVFTLQTPFKPDAVLSLNDTAALYDTTYRRHPNVFRLVAPAGRQYLFQAHDPEELNSWLHAINYAASFKSANVRIRPIQPPVLRSATSSPIPASPALSTHSSTSFRPPSQMTWGPSGASLESSATSVDSFVRHNSLAMESREESSATVRPSEMTVIGTGERSSNESAPLVGTSSRLLAEPRTSLQGSASKPLPNLPPQPFPPPLMPIVNSRADILRARIGNLDESILKVRSQVQDDLSLAKHLSILTPFRSSTREKVLTAIPPVEKRIRQTRMHLTKLICYREVLSRDLLVEDRETERFARQRSLRRSTSQKDRSPSIPQQHSTPTHWSSPLSQSHSSLVVPSAGDGSLSETGRESFESATESLRDDTRHAFTDDELDRLQTRSPPLMQRSRTEQDWNTAVEQLQSFSTGSSTPFDDELEAPPTTDFGTSATPRRRTVVATPTNGLSPTPSTVSLNTPS